MWKVVNERSEPSLRCSWARKRQSLACLVVSAVVFVGVSLGGSAVAGQLTYQPINPSFGGSPFNGDWLLNQANTTRPEAEGGSGGGGSDFPDFGDLFGDIDTVIGIDNPDDGDGGDVGDGGDGGAGGTG